MEKLEQIPLWNELLQRAAKAREEAYCPYSGFAVGAALLCADGAVYAGCNIENAAYGVSNCAERTAFFRAVSEGRREFSAIAVVGGKQGRPVEEFCAPCGVCRQVMAEFCEPDFDILLTDGKSIQRLSLEELLPHSFGRGNLNRA